MTLLDSHFRTVNDLSGLQIELSKAQENYTDLSEKLSQSQLALDALKVETHAAAQAHLESAQELSLLRHSLTDELVYLSHSLISTFSDDGQQSTLLEDIETLHRNLKELQSVRSYVLIVHHAVILRDSAIAEVNASMNSPVSLESLSKYRQLQDFVSRAEAACPAGEGESLYIISFLRHICEATWATIKAAFFSPLISAAETLNWPTTVEYASASLEQRRTFERAFTRLLELQKIAASIHPPKSEKPGLYPLQALVQPLSLRFKYHFEGTRQTNRLDKPEWFFTHILNAAHEHRPFMESVIQGLLASSPYHGINAWREFVFLLLPLLCRKLKRTVPSLLPHPSLLAYTIYQSLTFDASLEEDGFSLSETSATDQGETGKISDVILQHKEWFDTWVGGEKKFVEEQYTEIITSPDAWQIVDDDETETDPSADRELKTTNSARRIQALVEQVTDRYSGLPSFAHRTRFLVDVQLPILEQYHSRISSSLDTFETFSHALVRAVPGALAVSLGGREEASVNIDTRKLTSGVEGIQRLCKALLSAKYVEAALEGWGEELVFFLELWTEVNRKASLRAQLETSTLLSASHEMNPNDLADTIFEELVIQYRTLARRAEDIVVHQIASEIESCLKTHFASTPEGDADDTVVSQTMLPALGLLSTHLTYLRRVMTPALLTGLYRRIGARLSEHILQRQLLYRGNIAHKEARVIQAECDLWIETCQVGLSGALGGGRNRVEGPWLRLVEAVRLVGTVGDEREKIRNTTFGGETDGEWHSIAGISELSREEVGRILRRSEG